MNKELGLTGLQYNTALTVFFFTYSLFEIPSNIVLKLMRPSHWIAILVISWGTVCNIPLLLRTASFVYCSVASQLIYDTRS